MTSKITHELIRLNNVTAYYTFNLLAPDEKGRHALSVAGFDKETAKQLKQAGIKIKNKDAENAQKNKEAAPGLDDKPKTDRLTNVGDFVTLTTKFIPKMKNRKGEDIEAIQFANGTKLNIVSKPFDWSFQGKKGTNLGLLQLQIVDLVESQTGENFTFQNLDELEGSPNNNTDDTTIPF